MSKLPSEKTPLNQHSLREIELWLCALGAEKYFDDPCTWTWTCSKGSAEIFIKQDELMVVWSKGEVKRQFGFPYGLPREDIEAALRHGP